MGTKLLEKEFYFKKNHDLYRCTLKDILLITLLHRLASFLKRRYFNCYPTIPEIVTAFVAHRLYYVFHVLYKSRNVLRRVKERLSLSK